MNSKDVAVKIINDIGGNLNLFAAVKEAIKSLVDPVVAALKADVELITDEEQCKEVAKAIILIELEKTVPLAAIEAFVNARLPALVRPIAPLVEGAVFPKVEVDAISLIVELVFGLIDKRYGQDWFVQLKARVI